MTSSRPGRCSRAHPLGALQAAPLSAACQGVRKEIRQAAENSDAAAPPAAEAPKSTSSAKKVKIEGGTKASQAAKGSAANSSKGLKMDAK
eukprot:11644309-Alexandrium_andersonii.AAC.1